MLGGQEGIVRDCRGSSKAFSDFFPLLHVFFALAFLDEQIDGWADGVAFYNRYRACAAWCPAITVVCSSDDENDDAISDSDDSDDAAGAAKQQK